MSEQVTEPASAAGIGQRDHVERMLLQVLMAMPAGWSALRDATLPRQEDDPPERLGLLLVHPRIGIAVVDLVPGPTTEDAPLRLGRLLEASGWYADFGGLPPVIHLCVPVRAVRSLDSWLEQTFGGQPPLALHRDDWVAALQRLLGATPLLRTDQAGDGLPGGLARPRWTAARRRTASSPGLRGLLWFWGWLVLVIISGAAVLQYLGPLDEAAPGEGREPVATAAAPPLLLPALPALPAAEAPAAGAVPQLDRWDALPGRGAEPPPQAAPMAETLIATAPMPDEAASPALMGPVAAISDGPPLPSIPPPAESDGVPPSASVPVVVAPPAPLLLPQPPSPPPAVGVALPKRPTLAEVVIPSGPPSPEPPPAVEAAGVPTPPAFSRPEEAPPGVLAAVASIGGASVTGESGPAEDGARPEVPATPANAALPAAGDNSPAGNRSIVPPASQGVAVAAAAGPAPDEGGRRDGPPIPAMAEPPGPSKPVTVTPAMVGPVPSESGAPASQETEQAVSSGATLPPAAVSAPSATSAASPEARGRDPASLEPLTPQGEPAPPEARPAEAATAGRPDERGAAVSPQVELPVPEIGAGVATAVVGPAAPQRVAGAPPVVATLPPDSAASTPPAPQLITILRRGDAMLAAGDVAAARLLYARAAAAGSGEAMLALGKLQDPLFLEEIGARGTLGDAALAITWYRRAQARGILEARDRLVRHGVRPEE